MEGQNVITLAGIGPLQLPPLLIFLQMEPNVLLISGNDHCFTSLNNDTSSYLMLYGSILWCYPCLKTCGKVVFPGGKGWVCISAQGKESGSLCSVLDLSQKIPKPSNKPLNISPIYPNLDTLIDGYLCLRTLSPTGMCMFQNLRLYLSHGFNKWWFKTNK